MSSSSTRGVAVYGSQDGCCLLMGAGMRRLSLMSSRSDEGGAGVGWLEKVSETGDTSSTSTWLLARRLLVLL